MAEFDIVIHGGRVIDGTGNPWFYGDVAVKDGRIAAMGRINPETGQRAISAKGYVASFAPWREEYPSPRCFLCRKICAGSAKSSMSINGRRDLVAGQSWCYRGISDLASRRLKWLSSISSFMAAE